MLAPLCSDPDRRDASPSGEAKVIVERAIVETDGGEAEEEEASGAAVVNGGKRERPSSAASAVENQVGGH